MRQLGMIIVYILSMIMAGIVGAAAMYITMLKWMNEFIEESRDRRRHRYYD